MKLTTLVETTGIDFKEDAKNWFFGYTNSGLLVEVKLTSKKTKQVIVGYNLAGKEQLRFCSDLSDRWVFKSKILTNLNNLEEIPSLVQEATRVFEANNYGFKGERKNFKTSDEGYFEKTAIALKAIIDAEAFDFLTRNTFDQHDQLITIGQSKAVEANPNVPTWREHVVPCTMILQEAVQMVQNGCTVPELAQMLKENLAIVTITAEEAKKLDAVYQTTMPAGWEFGDSVFARLDAIGIAY